MAMIINMTVMPGTLCMHMQSCDSVWPASTVSSVATASLATVAPGLGCPAKLAALPLVLAQLLHWLHAEQLHCLCVVLHNS
jgi:hypothetical protein